MYRRNFLVTSGLLGAAGWMGRFASAEQRSSAVGQPSAEELAAISRFGLDLYHQLRGQPGNLFASPLSIVAALSMTAAGAAGSTRQEMMQALHLPADDPQHRAVGRLFASLSGGQQPWQGAQRERAHQQGYQLHLANAVYLQKGYVLRREFQRIVTETYNAAVEHADFRADAAAESERINRWVASQTQGRIAKLFPPGSLNQLTRLVLANAIYFKGSWKDEFNLKRTSRRPFTRSDGSITEVPMMHRRGTYPLLETPEFQLLELPYQRNTASMLILLPRQAAGLQRLEQELSVQQWSQWSSQLPQVPGLQVYLPRFKLHSQYTLNATLQAMGIREAFDQQRADFSQMVRQQSEGPLAISTVVHKAFCEVNEEGTEAAAATGVAIALRSAAEEPKVFRADRPFLFAIRHNPTGCLLFLGRVNDPNA